MIELCCMGNIDLALMLYKNNLPIMHRCYTAFSHVRNTEKVTGKAANTVLFFCLFVCFLLVDI